MDGFINLLKPAGMTSHDAVASFRRILRIKKIGHTGTLDPMACGVMCICVGRATRAAEYLESDRKTYRCEMKLGLTSDTGDIWGDVTEFDSAAADRVTEERILEALASMKGEQLQYPPMYSAVKVNGRRLYDYARKGESVEVSPRKITIFDIRPVHVLEEPRTVMFDVECSKGTYVRTICTELGRMLGCGAVMTFLLRTKSGAFDLADAVTFEEIIAAVSEAEEMSAEEIMGRRHDEPLKADLSRYIIPMDRMLDSFGKIYFNKKNAQRFVNGNSTDMKVVRVAEECRGTEDSRFRDHYRVYGPERNFLGIAYIDREKDTVEVDKVFYR